MKHSLTATERHRIDTVIPTSFWETYKPNPSNWGRQFRPFAEAREFAHSLGLASQGAWHAWIKTNRPVDIPAHPQDTYKEEWVSWGDWLGNGNVSPRLKQFRPFAEARNFVRGLELKNRAEWTEWSRSGKRPKDIPSTPHQVYTEWVDMFDWIGAGRRIGKFRDFREARAYVRSLGLANQSAWYAWIKTNRPVDIPAQPPIAYKEEWISWIDWLGNGYIRKKQFRSFTEAREFVRSLSLKNQMEWRAWCKSGDRPIDIPTRPDKTYKAEWVSYGDWLGSGRVANQQRQFRPFAQARKFARSLGLPNRGEWVVWCKSSDRPTDIPTDPPRVYAAEWVSWSDWGDWLRTGGVKSTGGKIDEHLGSKTDEHGVQTRDRIGDASLR